MSNYKIEDNSPTKIKVVGIGGGGSNAVKRMLEENMHSVEFIAVNTDVQVLNHYSSQVKDKSLVTFPIGKDLTHGLGAGGRPDIGKKAAEEDSENIENLLKGSDMVFLTAGMGGGTGTGAISVFGKIAKKVGALTVAVVTLPFDFEGKRKMQLAQEGVKELTECVDAIIVIPNQKLFKVAENTTSVLNAFKLADDVLLNGVKGISDLITNTGLINVDFNDLKAIMDCSGAALMGIGVGQGENGDLDAATHAINNPLLEDISIKGAKGVLINVTGGEDLTLNSLKRIVDFIQEYVDENASVKSGLVIDPTKSGQIQVSIVATGFPKKEQTKEVEIIEIQEDESKTISAAQWESSIEDPLSSYTSKFSNQYHGEENSSTFSTPEHFALPAFLREAMIKKK